MNSKFKISDIDWLMIITLTCILTIGNIYLYSASIKSFHNQIKWIMIGTVVMLSIIKVGYGKFLIIAYPIYLGVVSLLVAVLFLRPHRGAHSWIDLPGFSIQPSELAKVAIILALSRCLMNKRDQFTLKGLVLPIVITMFPVALILKQPDLGTAMVIIPVMLVILFVSGARKTHLLSNILIGLVSAIPMWMFILKQYQKNRILAFISPDKFAAREAYQLIMSIITIGSGGIFGAGWRNGVSNKLGLLPDRHTDFIFVVIAEEGGFIVAGVLLLLFLLFVICGLNTAASTKEPGGRIIATGATALIGIQVIINIGVVEAILPTTGITLPLISYGGSSMLSTFILIGLILSVGNTKTTVFHKETFLGKND